MWLSAKVNSSNERFKQELDRTTKQKLEQLRLDTIRDTIMQRSKNESN
jgi:transcriptional regulator GlxA family with amidase domain